MFRTLTHLLLAAWFVLPAADGAKAAPPPVSTITERAPTQLQHARLICGWYWTEYRLRPRCYWLPRSGLYPQYPFFRRPRELQWHWMTLQQNTGFAAREIGAIVRNRSLESY